MASYQIKSGDTLGGLANTYKTDVATLQKLNPTIADPNKIFAGQSLTIPDTQVPTGTQVTTNTVPVSSQTAVPTAYTIKPGDTLSAIARANGTDINTLLSMNPGIKDPNQIYSGATLNLPQKGTGIEDVKNRIPAVDAAVRGLSDEQLNDPAAVGSAIQGATGDLGATATPTQPSVWDGMNKGFQDLATLYQNYLTPTDDTKETESYVQTYQNLLKKEGLVDDGDKEGLKTQLANIQNVMLGTKGDIRTELEAAGVPITESGVEYLTTKRNEKLLIKAEQLNNLINAKEDYIDKIVNLTGEDRKEAQKRIENQFNFKQQELQLRLSLYNAGINAEQLEMQKQKDALARVKAMADVGAFTGASDERLKQIAKDTGGLYTVEDLQAIRDAQKADVDTQVVQLSDGRDVLINKNTGAIIKVIGGGGSGGGGGKLLTPTEAAALGVPYGTTQAGAFGKTAQKPPTAAQETVAGYAVRLEQAAPILKDLESKIAKMNVINYETQIKLKPAFQSANMQSYMQASRNFINAVLRRESGAVISPTEFSEARQQYLPQAGDSEQVLRQKEANRQLVYSSLKNAAGPAYQSVEELLGGGAGSELEADIIGAQNNYETREELIDALTPLYPELTESEISSKVYYLIPDR